VPTYKVRINGTAEFQVTSSQTSASAAADEIQRWVRTGDGNGQEIRLDWDKIAVLEVIKESEHP
jgi:hypothetical protein